MDKKKILLIEDEREMNFRLIYKLKEFYTVEIAISVDAVINLLKQQKDFDLIILDIMMAPGPYSSSETDEGIETGWILYSKVLKNLNKRIVIWTKNSDIFQKSWGTDVVERVIKSSDENQLVDIARRHIGG
jgi:CheY-like chemotaxis protein